MVPTAAWGLVAPEVVVFPLAMSVGAIFAAIAASWTGYRLLPPDGSRSRLLPIVGATEAAAIVVTVGLLALPLVLKYPPASPIYVFLVCAGIIALGATVATRLLRTTEERPGRDRRITACLLILAILAFLAAPYALCETVVRCGP